MACALENLASNDLLRAWALLEEYHDFVRLAHHRHRLDEQLGQRRVSWKAMVRAVLTRWMLNEEDINETEMEISQANVQKFLQPDAEESLTERWFEINELKECFQHAMETMPSSRSERQALLRRIIGYPAGYSEEENEDDVNEAPLDLSRIWTLEEQERMRTGDLIKFSDNRLHNAFYIYRLPRKGLWVQIQQMWSSGQRENFTFDVSKVTDGEEILLIPAMDEYGYGVPYLFATKAQELLPRGVLYKYVDINCPQISKQIACPTVALVHRHLQDRLINPHYYDEEMGVPMEIEPSRFPQEYVAVVNIGEGEEKNVLWTRRRNVTNNLNENREIFYSRRILEAEEYFHPKN